MKNIVELEYRDKIYRAENNVHPEFYNALLNLFAYGRYPDSEQFDSITRLLSLHPSFSGEPISKIPNALSSVGIYAFTDRDSALKFYNYSISSNLVQYPVTYFDYDGVNSYSLTSINNHSFSLTQSFYYSPTAEGTNFVFEIESFATKTCFLRRLLPSYLLEYLPFTYITTQKLVGEPTIKLNPSESFNIKWLIDFDVEMSDNSTTLKSTVNNINAPMHDQLKIILCDIMSSSSFTYPSTTADSANYFQIEGIIAFTDPTGALYNNGSTANETAFYLTPDSSIVSSNLSLTGNNTVSYFVSYTNNTGEPQQIGSLLLSGERSSGVFSIVPISWVSAKDLWGVEKRIVQPRERLEITWTIKLTPTPLETQVQQQTVE